MYSRCFWCLTVASALVLLPLIIEGLLLEDCGPLYTKDRKKCEQTAKECMNVFQVHIKWTGPGTKGSGGLPRGDGGCQCDQYCGYLSAPPCRRDDQCYWDPKAGRCFNKLSRTPGKPILICPPTQAPSKSPATPRPSITPSLVPSIKPSTSPISSIPSRVPSRTPSRSPRISPSKSPSTTSPTKSPSLSPSTSKPSVGPSRAPFTSFPSRAPFTTQPSRVPSKVPSSSNPTQTPSTSKPSNGPSKTPSTSFPSVSPTKKPSTRMPTPDPSKAPSTSKPSKVPSRSPLTSRPTTSPSRRPTSGPTTSPSKRPTSSRPTQVPSLSPSTSNPSLQPSASPSYSPTFHPIRSCTEEPTASPTLSPTNLLTPSPTSGVCFKHETGWTKATVGSTCWIGLDGLNKWGWTNGPYSNAAGTTINYEIWAGAGQCDTTKGYLSGTGTVTVNANGTATLFYQLASTARLNGNPRYYVGAAQVACVNPGKLTPFNGNPTLVPSGSVTNPFYFYIHFDLTISVAC